MKPKVLVFAGLGIGCEKETAAAYKEVGAGVDIVHINKVLSGDVDMMDYHVLNFPGGFMHGDMLGSALAMANYLELVPISGKKAFMDVIQEEFIPKGGIIYGQCNGFQLMVKLGMLPGWDGEYTNPVLSLTHNKPRPIYDVNWSSHVVEEDTHCVAFQGIDYMCMPCRHGEGRIVFGGQYGAVSSEEAGLNWYRVNEEHVLLRYIDPVTLEPTMDYPYNPNGSMLSIAGLCDSTGRVFGHMAHPEAATLAAHRPEWQKQKDALRRQGTFDADKIYAGQGRKVFSNIVDFVQHAV